MQMPEDRKKASGTLEKFLSRVNYTRLRQLSLSGCDLKESFKISSDRFYLLFLKNMMLPLEFWNDLALKIRNFNGTGNMKENNNCVNLSRLLWFTMSNVHQLPGKDDMKQNKDGNVLKDICGELTTVEQLEFDKIDYRFIEMFLYYLCDNCNVRGNKKKELGLIDLSLKWRLYPDASEFKDWYFDHGYFDGVAEEKQEAIDQFKDYLQEYDYSLATCAPNLKALTISLLKSTENYLDLICKILYKILSINYNSNYNYNGNFNSRKEEKEKEKTRKKIKLSDRDDSKDDIKNDNYSKNYSCFQGFSNIKMFKMCVDTRINLDKIDGLFRNLESIGFNKLESFICTFLLESHNASHHIDSVASMLKIMQILDSFISIYDNMNTINNNILFTCGLELTLFDENDDDDEKNGFTQEEESDIKKLCTILKKWYMNNWFQFVSTINLPNENKYKRFKQLINSQIFDNKQFQKEMKKREKEGDDIGCDIQYISLMRIKDCSEKYKIKFNVNNAVFSWQTPSSK